MQSLLTAPRALEHLRVTAHTLRHASATWLREATGDTRLVAEYLGHADLSSVSCPSTQPLDPHAAVQALGDSVYEDSPADEADAQTRRRPMPNGAG
jgi:hypothetical protein